MTEINPARVILSFVLDVLQEMYERDHEGKPVATAYDWPWRDKLGMRSERALFANYAARAAGRPGLFEVAALSPTVNVFRVWGPSGQPVESTFATVEDGKIVFGSNDPRFAGNGRGIDIASTSQTIELWLPILDPTGQITTIGDAERGAYVATALRNAIWEKLPDWDGKDWNHVREALRASGKNAREIEAMPLREVASAIQAVSILPTAAGIVKSERRRKQKKYKTYSDLPAEAAIVLLRNPSWSDAEIARSLSVHPSTLSKCEAWRDRRQVLRTDKLPVKGRKLDDGTVDDIPHDARRRPRGKSTDY